MITAMDRVPASAAGAMRAILPATACATPSTLTCTAMPGLSCETSCVPTLPASSSLARSTMVSTVCSMLSFSPGTTWRFDTTPAIGATRAASRRLTRLVLSCICDAVSCARAVSSAAALTSRPLDEMNCWSAKRLFDSCWRSTWASWARADPRAASRSATRLVNSARSTVPSFCPALTRLPSATLSDSRVPGALARTTAVPGATSGPENSMTLARDTSCGFTTSAALNSSATSALSFLLAAASLLLARHTNPRAMAAMVSAAPPPISHCLRMKLAPLIL